MTGPTKYSSFWPLAPAARALIGRRASKPARASSSAALFQLRIILIVRSRFVSRRGLARVGNLIKLLNLPTANFSAGGRQSTKKFEMTSQLASQAQTGFAKSELYDKYRPSYPSNSVQNLLRNIRVEGEPKAKVLDLAAGTGKFTELICGREENYVITAVEPHEGMRSELAKKSLPNVAVLDGISTSIPVDSESIDAVIVAQVGTSSRYIEFNSSNLRLLSYRYFHVQIFEFGREQSMGHVETTRY